MNISQVKKLRKIVRIKKLATKNNKIFVCTMKKTSVHYKMVLTIIPCLFLFLCPISNIEKIFMHILVFRPFQSSSLMITSQTTCMVRRRGNVFIQHRRFNIKVFLKRSEDGRSIIYRHWPKVTKTFNINEGSIFAFCFSSFQMRYICLCTVYDANFERF